jgi:hypothetical protein
MTGTLRCAGEPISWLRLEQHHLGELSPADAAAVEAHLRDCPACSECARVIEEDDARELPPLHLPETRSRQVQAKRAIWKGRASVVVAGLAMAAAALLGVGRSWHRGGGLSEGPGSDRVKGGDVVFSLVRDDGVRVGVDGGVYADSDRWKVLVTCPPGLEAPFDVVVLDEGGASFPMVRAPRLRCGNDVSMPGAFRLTGPGDEMVCLVWSEQGGGRPRDAKLPSDLGESSRCIRLRRGEPGGR